MHLDINLASTDTTSTRQFPEPLLWIIFRALAEALHTMLTGHTIAHNDPPDHQRDLPNAVLPRVPGWQSIVNTDIKLGNVVLGHAQDGYYPAYKTPKMIDFGLAFDDNRYPDRNSKKRSGRPVRYRQIGTRGSVPPVSLAHCQSQQHYNNRLHV